jgi:PAS domain S-box-containing protein
VGDDTRAQVVAALLWLGVPHDLAGSVNSTISAAVTISGTPVARIHLVRFGTDQPIAADDVATVEAIASTAALVLERRAVEDRLAASRARFEAVFELAPIAMVAVDNDRTIRYNRRALELYGRDREQMTQLAFQPDAPWIPADQTERWEAMRWQVAAGDRVTSERLAILRPDGERREIEGSAIQIVTPSGLLGGVVTVLTDLTDQLSLEAQFRHAQKMEALGRLAGGIAHDFNNVLMSIIGYAEYVARDARAGRPVDVIQADEVVASARRAIELTARLTTFARR